MKNQVERLRVARKKGGVRFSPPILAYLGSVIVPA